MLDGPARDLETGNFLLNKFTKLGRIRTYKLRTAVRSIVHPEPVAIHRADPNGAAVLEYISTQTPKVAMQRVSSTDRALVVRAAVRCCV